MFAIIEKSREATNSPSLISRFSMSGVHAHWVGSLDTPSHATKGKKCAKGTGSLITLLIDFQR